MALLFTVLRRSLANHRRYVLFYVPTVMLLVTLWVTEPLYGRYVIDSVTTAGRDLTREQFFRLLGGWLLIYLCINATQATNKLLRWKMLRYVLVETRQRYYNHLLQLDVAYHVRAKTGELMKRIDNAADAAHDLTSQLLLELAPAFVSSIVFFSVSFWVSWQLATIALAMVPVYIIILTFYVRWTKPHWQKVHGLWVQSVGRGYDAVTNIFTVKSSGQEELEIQRMRDVDAKGIAELNGVDKIWAILEGIGYFMLMRILIIGAGIWLFVRGDISLGSLFFFQFSFFRTIVPFEMLGGMLPQFNDKMEKLRMGEELYRTAVKVKNGEHPHTIEPLSGAISLKDVSFSYGDAQALSHVSLDIRPGEHVAIVGHSGAGKSTLAMLLNRFYDVTDGAIVVDGMDLRDLDMHWWRRQIGLVLQENITFNDSVLENIRYARPNATLQEVMDAAKRASAHDFISKLPNGYDTLVGERGIRLSGGERQRVAIARAILKRPTIVILDEATSALDSITERDVQQGIKELIADRTAVVIAHRLSTVRSVDRIAVFENGRLTACAPHAALMDISPVYRRMVELQREGVLFESGNEENEEK